LRNQESDAKQNASNFVPFSQHRTKNVCLDRYFLSLFVAAVASAGLSMFREFQAALIRPELTGRF
jgi:hypothetical protein